MIEKFILVSSFKTTLIAFFSIFFLSILIDLILGEFPLKIHPVALIGKLINFLTDKLLKFKNIFSGLVLTILTLSIILIICFIIINILKYISLYFLIVFFAFILSSLFSIKLLLKSALNVEKELEKNDIMEARKKVSYLVSRNTNFLDEKLLISATIESLSENVTDSVIAPLFYYLLFGFIIIGIAFFSNYFQSTFILNDMNLFLINSTAFTTNLNVIYLLFALLIIPLIYRVVNTLDAMVAYKNDKYINIGFIPAHLDDILNFIPARIGGFIVVIASYILNYNWINSFFILRRDARNCESPNSGFTMAAFAGALSIKLVKKDHYIIGDEFKLLEANDITRAVKLSIVTIFLFILIPIIAILLLLIFVFF